MATRASEPLPPEHLSLAELTVSLPEGDLLDVQPADLGPGEPATAALEAERGPRPPGIPARGQ